MNIKEVRCSICNEKQTREIKFTEAGALYHVKPGTNIRWKGRECPNCIALGPLLNEPSNLSNRHCNVCGLSLPKTRYFTCEDCRPELEVEIDNDEDVYDADDLDEFTESLAEGLFEMETYPMEEDYEDNTSEEANEGSDYTDEVS